MPFKNIYLIVLTAASQTVAVPEKSFYAQEKDDGMYRRTVLSKNINRILEDSALERAYVGVKIVDLKNGKTLYKRNSNKLFHPASNQKLFTTAAAIRYLKPGHRLETKVGYSGKISDGVLHGNLYVKGSGDPLITTEDLDSIALHLRTNGISAINGNIIGDISYFDTIYWGRGWMWDDEPQASEPFISSLSVNGNSVKIIVRSGATANEQTSYETDPPTSFCRIINMGVTSSDPVLQELEVTRQPRVNDITISGELRPGTSKEFNLSVWDPDKYFLILLKERINHYGIKIGGGIKYGRLNNFIKITELSHDIDSVLHRVNKYSDNLAAENLLKILDAQTKDSSGSASGGISIIKKYLFSEGIDTSRITIADGSGVSWYNEISPEAVVQLLQMQYSHKNSFRRFYETLSIAGFDGTLKYRMKNSGASLNIRAKTGTLSGVSCISGYVTSADDRLLAFSILCNHVGGDLDPVKEIQDKILLLLSATAIGS